MRLSCLLVWRRPLDVINDEHIDWPLCPFELQTELLLNSREERRLVAVEEENRADDKRAAVACAVYF